MGQASVEGAFSILPAVAGSFGWADNTMTFTPGAALSGGTLYTANISTDAQDVAGNPLAAAYSWSFTTAGESPVIVEFPDAGLEAAIRGALNKPTGDIYKSELETLTVLNADNLNISDLTGLEYCINLQGLNLWNNMIADISPLSGLTNLHSLALIQNQIINISPLSGLTNLNTLDLRYNLIEDISALSGLNNLTQLILDANQISDIPDLSGLTNLQQLYLNFNQITDISALSGLNNLNTLQINSNQVSNISALSGLHNLGHLLLYMNQITDISALSGLTNLGVLGLDGNKVTDISAVSGLTNLSQLNLYGNNVTDISPLVANSGFNSGDWVDIRNNPLSAVSLYVYIPALQARGAIVDYNDQPISVITNGATDVTIDSATLNGSLNSLGTHETMDVSFVWGKESQSDPANYTDETTPVTVISAGDFSASLADIDSNTTYYYRARAAGVINWYGEELSFTTVKVIPTITTNEATGVTADSATLNLTYDFNDYGSGQVRFAYKKAAESAWTNTEWVDKSGSDTFFKTISGLAHHTDYVFYAQLQYESTIIDGQEMQFTTANIPPTAPVINITPDEPLSGDDLVCTVITPSADPDGDPITYTYEWYKNDIPQPTKLHHHRVDRYRDFRLNSQG